MTQPPARSPDSVDRIAFLDVLRFIAATAVFLQHSLETHGEWGRFLADTLSPGVFGVALFFIVSGFVIPLAAREPFDVKRFALRRIFRIYPLVLATFALLAIVGYSRLTPEFDYVRSATAKDWIANLLLIQDYVGARPLWGVTWTLSLEFAWYGLFGLLFFRFGSRFDRWLCVVAPVLLILAAMASLATGIRLPLGRVGMIYAAIFGVRVFRYHSGALAGSRLAIDAAVFMGVMLVCNVVSFGVFKHPNISMNQAVIPWLMAPCVFLLVACHPAVRRSAPVNARAIQWLGAVSFSTYLLHPFAIAMADSVTTSSLAVPLGWALTVILSALGYYCIELPGQRLSRLFERRPAVLAAPREIKAG